MGGIISTFSGIGGLDIGVEAGFGERIELMCEIDPWKQRVLDKHFGVLLCDDIRKLVRHCPVDGDVGLVGGYPCGGNSVANNGGKRGLCHPQTMLAYEMLELLGQKRPIFYLSANVPASRKYVLEEQLTKLHQFGYDATWGVARACDHGAPMERARLFVFGVRRDCFGHVFEGGGCAGVGEWGVDMPVNDYWHKDRKDAVGAYGDAVVPAVAIHVSKVAARLVSTGFDSGAVCERLPMIGVMTAGLFGMRVMELADSPWVVDQDFDGPEFVRVGCNQDMESARFAPTVGVRLSDDGARSSVVVVGGDVREYPSDIVERGWPAPTRHDCKDRGSISTWFRKSVALSTLVQYDLGFDLPDRPTGRRLLESVSGVGAGPEPFRFAMGFPVGWHDL